jgi:antitoxin HicB
VRLTYPVEIEPDGDTLLLTCPLLPEVNTFGDDRADALRHGTDALEEAIAARIAAWSDLPMPPAADGTADERITLSLQTTLKALLFSACRSAGITRADLVRRLGWHREQVDRLFRLDHASRIDQLDAAFAAIGKDVSVELSDAA